MHSIVLLALLCVAHQYVRGATLRRAPIALHELTLHAEDSLTLIERRAAEHVNDIRERHDASNTQRAKYAPNVAQPNTALQNTSDSQMPLISVLIPTYQR